MKAIYLTGLIVGMILLFAIEAETISINIIGLAMCVASANKLKLFSIPHQEIIKKNTNNQK